jgi:hypothetical protein
VIVLTHDVRCDQQLCWGVSRSVVVGRAPQFFICYIRVHLVCVVTKQYLLLLGVIIVHSELQRVTKQITESYRTFTALKLLS